MSLRRGWSENGNSSAQPRSRRCELPLPKSVDSRSCGARTATRRSLHPPNWTTRPAAKGQQTLRRVDNDGSGLPRDPPQSHANRSICTSCSRAVAGVHPDAHRTRRGFDGRRALRRMSIASERTRLPKQGASALDETAARDQGRTWARRFVRGGRAILVCCTRLEPGRGLTGIDWERILGCDAVRCLSGQREGRRRSGDGSPPTIARDGR